MAAYSQTVDAGIRSLHAVKMQRIAMTGFIIHDPVPELHAYPAGPAPWLRSGALVFNEHIVSGFENAPAAPIDLMKGAAIGKRLVQVELQ